MITTIGTLFGFALIDTLDVLLISVTAAIAYDARSCGRPPWRDGSAFLLGLFTATALFGVVVVLGLQVSATTFNVTITPEIRYWSELLGGCALIIGMWLLARASPSSTSLSRIPRRSSMVLAFSGIGIGLVQAPTAIPYLAWLTLISTAEPVNTIWPVLVVVYCAVALSLPLLTLVLATRDSVRAHRLHRAIMRIVEKWGTRVVCVILGLCGVALIVDALLHYPFLV